MKILLGLLLLAAPAAKAADLAIVDVTVLHPERVEPSEQHQTVVISGDRITAVGPAATVKAPAGATIIEGKGRFVLPGLIDGHVHFFQSGNPYTRPDAADLGAFVPYAKEDARNRARLPATFKAWLASGVTSVVDTGGPMWNFEVREQSRKLEAAPRVLVAGPLVSTVEDKKLDLGDPPIVKVANAAEAKALAEKELAKKPDFLKVWLIREPGDDLAAKEAIVKAVADAGHAAGVRLLVHALELSSAKAALRAGADVLVHSVVDAPVDAELVALAQKNKALYCPTLFVAQSAPQVLGGGWKPSEPEARLADPKVLAQMNDAEKVSGANRAKLPAWVRALQEARKKTRPLPPYDASPQALRNLNWMWNAGVTVVLGTDAGNIGVLHGPAVFAELDAMVRAGLTPRQALQAATVNGAKLLGMEKDLGSVEAGKLADLVVLDADPLADVVDASRIHRVVKGGKVHDPKALIDSIR